jgi:hypothetical protein
MQMIFSENKILLLKIFFTLFFQVYFFSLFSQERLRIENGTEYNDSLVQPFMRALISNNDYVLVFRTYFPCEAASGSDYFVFSAKGERFSSYFYSGTESYLTELSLSAVSLKQIWDTFDQNDLLKLRDEKDIPNFCARKYDIYESYTYEFTIFYKGMMKVLSYYSPEYYIDACYGISERQNIINSVAVIKLLAVDN